MSHSAADGQTVFTAPRVLFWFSLLTLGLLAFLILLVVGVGIGMFLTGLALAGLFFLALGAFFLVLLRTVARNTRGLGGWRIALDGAELHLALPSARSLTRPLEPVARTLPLSDIAAVETRLETYRSLGMANMNRSYALRLRDGDMLFLGEDRAQGTGMAHHHVADAAQALVARGIALNDLGMSEGSGGFLGVAFTRPADWDAPALDDARAEMLHRRARRTGILAGAGALIVLLLIAAQNLF